MREKPGVLGSTPQGTVWPLTVSIVPSLKDPCTKKLHRKPLHVVLLIGHVTHNKPE